MQPFRPRRVGMGIAQERAVLDRNGLRHVLSPPAGHEVPAYGRDGIGGNPGRIRAVTDDGKYLMRDAAQSRAASGRATSSSDLRSAATPQRAATAAASTMRTAPKR